MKKNIFPARIRDHAAHAEPVPNSYLSHNSAAETSSVESPAANGLAKETEQDSASLKEKTKETDRIEKTGSAKSGNKKIVSFYIEEELADLVRKLAARKNKSYSSIASEAFRQHLIRQNLI